MPGEGLVGEEEVLALAFKDDGGAYGEEGVGGVVFDHGVEDVVKGRNLCGHGECVSEKGGFKDGSG